MENAMGDSIKGFANVQAENIHSLSLIDKHVTVLWKEIKLIKQDLPFINPCRLSLIPWLSCVFHVMALTMIWTMTLPGTKPIGKTKIGSKKGRL